MKEYGIVDLRRGGDQGHRLHDRRAHGRASIDKMVAVKVVKAGIDYQEGLHDRIRLQGRRHGPVEVGCAVRRRGTSCVAPSPSRGNRLTDHSVADPGPAAPAAARAGRAVVALRDVSKVFSNGTAGAQGHVARRRARRVRQPARPLRLRQVDGAAHHRRARRADLGHDRLADEPARCQGHARRAISASSSRSRR